MADTGRQSLTDKAASTIKPESQKSTLESVTDSAKGTADSVASALQPEQKKSATQDIADTFSTSNTDGGDKANAQKQGEGLLAQAQNAAAAGLNTVGQAASNLAASAQEALGQNNTPAGGPNTAA